MKSIVTLLMVCLLYICCSGYAVAQDVEGGFTVGWNQNTESDLAGYKIYYGTEPGNYTMVIDVGLKTSATVKGLTLDAEYYTAVTAYDTWKNESGYSIEIMVTAKDIILPAIPTGYAEKTTNVNNQP